MPSATEAALGYDPAIKPYAYNPQRARELLKSINYDGRKVRLWSVQTNSSPESPEIIQLIDGYLRAAGFQTEITAMEIGAFARATPTTRRTSRRRTRPISTSTPRVRVRWCCRTSRSRGSARLPAATSRAMRICRPSMPSTSGCGPSRISTSWAISSAEVNRETYGGYNLIPIAARAVVAAAGPRVGTWSPGRYGFAWNLETVTRGQVTGTK